MTKNGHVLFSIWSLQHFHVEVLCTQVFSLFHVLHISFSAFKVRLVERCLLSADMISGAQPDSLLGSWLRLFKTLEDFDLVRSNKMSLGPRIALFTMILGVCEAVAITDLKTKLQSFWCAKDTGCIYLWKVLLHFPLVVYFPNSCCWDESCYFKWNNFHFSFNSSRLSSSVHTVSPIPHNSKRV